MRGSTHNRAYVGAEIAQVYVYKFDSAVFRAE